MKVFTLFSQSNWFRTSVTSLVLAVSSFYTPSNNGVSHSIAGANGTLDITTSITECDLDFNYDLIVALEYTGITAGTAIDISTSNGDMTSVVSDGSGLQIATFEDLSGTGQTAISVIATSASDPNCTDTMVYSEPDCQSENPNCTTFEMLYANDTGEEPGNQGNVNGATHKFIINADGSLSEIFSNPPTNTIPWSFQNPDVFFPHGVSQDKNGFIYIGELNAGGHLVKLDCDANVIDDDAEDIAPHNHVIVGNFVYYVSDIGNAQNRVVVHNLCDGMNPAEVGFVNLGGLADDEGAQGQWGITVNPNDGMIYVTDNYSSISGGGQNSVGGDVYAIDPTDNPEDPGSIWQTNATIQPVLEGLGNLWGIAFDDDNRMFIVSQRSDGQGNDHITDITRYDLQSGDWTQSGIVSDTEFNASRIGFYDGWGISYSKFSDKLYVTSFQEDCVAEINPNTMVYEGTAAGYVPEQVGKAIGILPEGCYTGPSEITQTVCAGSTEPILLLDLIGCDVCAGNWSPDGMAAALGTYNSCDQTFTPNGTEGQTVFNFSGESNLCGAYSVNITVNVQEMELEASVECDTDDNTGSVLLTVTGGVGPYNILVTDDMDNVAGGTGGTGDENGFSGTVNGLADGNFTAEVTDGTGTCVASTTFEVMCAQECMVICPDDVVEPVECLDLTESIFDVPANTPIAESVDPSITGEPMASSEDCDLSFTYQDEIEFNNDECPIILTFTRTFTVTIGDEVSTCEQVISLQDTSEPTLNCPENVTVDCNDVTIEVIQLGEDFDFGTRTIYSFNDNVPSATATDNCQDPDVSSFVSDDSGEGCPRVLVRQWSASGICEDVTCEQVVTIDDMIPPTLDTCPDMHEVTLNICGEFELTPDELELSGSDNCADDVTITLDPSMLTEPGVTPVTVEVSDGKNIDNSCVISVNVLENPDAFTIEAGDDDLGMACNDEPFTITKADLLSNDEASDGSTLEVQEVNLVNEADGTIVDNEDGTCTFTPAEGFEGSVQLTYIVTVAGNDLFNPENGHFYEFVTDTEIRWDDARVAAEGMTLNGLQGYLATITSASEDAFIFERLEGNGWIGASDAAVEDEWRWVTGPEAGLQFWSGEGMDLGGMPVGGEYNNWDVSPPTIEPNDSGGNEDYAHMAGPEPNGAGAVPGTWNDFPITNSFVVGYIVEYGGLEDCEPELTATGNITLEVETCNEPPMAVCQDVEIFDCEGDATAEDFDGGSTDPDMDDELTFSVSPEGPYAQGTTMVVLTVSDGQSSNTCEASITVQDTIKPSLATLIYATQRNRPVSGSNDPQEFPARLVTIDPATAEITLIGDVTEVNSGNPVGFVHAMDQLSNGVIYGTSFDRVSGSTFINGQLFFFNPADGQAFNVGPATEAAQSAMAFDNNSTLWSIDWSGGANDINQIDLNTGAVTEVLSNVLPSAWWAGMAKHPLDGDIYFAAWATGAIYKLDPNTNAVTLEATHSGPSRVGDCFFDAAGNFYLTGAGSSTGLWQIDLTTGDDTFIADYNGDDNANAGLAAATIGGTLAPVVAECEATVSIPVAIDNCDGEIQGTTSDTLFYDEQGTFEVEWTFTDNAGNACVIVQLVIIDDLTPPEFTCPESQMVECPDDVPPAADLTAEDNCDGTVNVTSIDSLPDNPCNGTILRTYTAIDAAGNSSECSVEFTVNDTTNPEFSDCPMDMTIECDETFTPTVLTATDNCSDDITVEPTVADVDAQNCTTSTTYLATVTDDCGNSATCEFTVTQTDMTPPIFDQECPAPIAVQCAGDIPPAETLTASDNCDDDVEVTVVDTPADLDLCEGGTVLRTFTADDGCGNTAECSYTIAIQGDQEPPSLICTKPGPVFCAEDEMDAQFLLDNGFVEVEDNCDDDVDITVGDIAELEFGCTVSKTFNFIATDDCGNTSICAIVTSVHTDNEPPVMNCTNPPDLGCNPTEKYTAQDLIDDGFVTATDDCGPAIIGDLSWMDTIVTECDTIVNFRFRATDFCNNQSEPCTVSVTWRVNTPLSITCPSDLDLECDESDIDDQIATWLMTVSAEDACNDEQITNNYDPNGFTDICENSTSQVVTFTATDDCGDMATCSATITIEDTTPPVLTCPADADIECSEDSSPAGQGMATASDNCTADVNVTSNDVITPGVCESTFTISRTWTATDDCGNSTQCVQTIEVSDTTPPVLTCAANTTVECTEDMSPATQGMSTAMDACDPNPTVTSSDEIVPGNCAGNYTINRTWTATDECGNSTQCVQVITVQDTNPPMLTCPENMTIECLEDATPANTGDATASDMCSNETVTFDDVTVEGDCPVTNVITRTWTATDDCGNSTQCVQTITVEDTTPPVITCPADTLVNCDAEMTVEALGDAMASDVCASVSQMEMDDVILEGDCIGEYTLQRTFTVTEECGAMASCMQTIMVQDTTPPTIVCPMDADIECTEDTSPAAQGMATASDNCTTDDMISSSDVITPGECEATFTITRTWMATDDCGNTSSCVQTIEVSDNTPPVLTCAANATVECTEDMSPATQGMSTATDACDPNPTVTSNDMIVPGNCAGNYTINRTWTATDECGNSTQCVQVITVQDTNPPMLTCPANATVECLEDATPAATGEATASDMCSNETVTFDDVTVEGDCPVTNVITRTWTATDDCGNSTQCVQTITVEDTTPPVITCPADTLVNCDAEMTIEALGNAMASDVCASVSQMEMDDIIIEGDCIGEYTLQRTFTVTEECGASASCMQTIMVQDTTPPVITCPMDADIECTVDTSPAAQGMATAEDNCTETVTISSSDVITPGVCDATFTITRTWMATDDCGNISTCEQTIEVSDTTPPVLTCADPVTVECTDDMSPANTGSSTAVDACGPSTVSSADMIDPGNCPGNYTINRTWTASDECGNSTQCVQVITVQDTNPPMLDCPASTTVECDEDTSPTNTGAATASDMCSNETVMFDDVTIEGDCPTLFTIDRTWTATDDCGNSTQCVQTITVEDTTAPTITCPQEETVECSDDMSVQALGNAGAFDACLMVTVTSVDAITQGDCMGESTILRTFTATDECDNTNTCAQTINVVDTTPPVLTCPDNADIECTVDTSPATQGMATAEDNCTSAVTVTNADVITPGICEATFTITRTWTATDDCGNSTQCVQTIEVSDTTPPALTCAAPVTIECTDDMTPANTGMSTAADACDPAPTVSSSDEIVPGNCAGNFTINRTWTATDECGNSTQCVQVITVQDTNPPAIACPDDQVVECDEDTSPAMTGMASATDLCSNETITFDDSSVEGDCPTTEIITRTWTATDDCGNATDCEQIITVVDTTAPTIVCPDSICLSADKFFCQKEDVELTLPEVSDNCDEETTIMGVRDDGLALDDPYPVGITIITWTVTGECSGKSSSCTQMIEIKDVQPPTMLCQSFTVGLNAIAGVVQIPDSLFLISIFDNCTDDIDALMATLTVSQNIFECADLPEALVIVNAMDEFGNVGECRSTVTLLDFHDPVAICQDITVELDNGSVTISPEDVDGGSSDNTEECGISFEVNPMTFTQPGDMTATLFVSDNSGNVDSCEAIVTVTGTPGELPLELTGKLLLEGPIDASHTMMIPALTYVLPLEQPFDAAPYNYTGAEKVTQMPEDVIDWVLIELRDANDPSIVLRSRAAFIMTNGAIVDLDGQSNVQFLNTASNNYYVSIRNRNHLVLMTDGAIPLNNNNAAFVDFTMGNVMGGSSMMRELSNGSFAAYAGDVNADGKIDAADRNITWNDRNQIGYLISDANLDGKVDAADRNITWNNRNKVAGF